MSAPQRLGSSAWWRSSLPATLGHCVTDRLQIEPGLALVYMDYRAQQPLQQTSLLERDNRCLTLTVALQGQSSTTGVDGQRFDFVAGHSTLAAFASVRGERCFPAGQTLRQLRLVADEAVLQRYGLADLLDGVRFDQSARALHFGAYGASTSQWAAALLPRHAQTKEDERGSLLGIQIAALSLLSEQTRQLRPPPSTSALLRPADQDKILQARDILLRDYAQPLTVAYLCAAVGTNAFALKTGFRLLFGSSPHRMLTRIRMERAWALLDSGQRVSSVAFQVGYQHVSSFSTAFERHFGRTPKTVAGERWHTRA
ncbi:helix-turn-helix transcriptional regulator [Comamonas piscis]|uniref:Helix-turn-helix transcriptional regulator n=1 Tax=Comamonas piscis TaxID=1562974 RepID=A0A7G5EJT4_9BURK|nr:AraC family transcriptional regulator [Comamonas piscis]QMV74259.1 helix-turn-helix transcriptional regulator [Comamonas piscis]WSO32703.1 AraC family transcriptional regulator [Comamonas piscis]